MRYATLPFAFIQSVGMVFFINSLMPGVIAMDFVTVIFAAFVMSAGAMILLFIADWITERGLTNGVSVVIFASIVSGIVTQLFATFGGLASRAAFWSMLAYAIIVIGLLTV